FLHALHQVVQVAPYLQAHEAVDGCGCEALVLAELWEETGGGGDEGTREDLLDDGAGALLVLGGAVAVDEADDDRLDTGLLEVLGNVGDLVVGWGGYPLAGGAKPLRDHLPVAAADESPVLPGDLHLNRVVEGALMACDVEDVAVAPGGDHPDRGAVVLQQ